MSSHQLSVRDQRGIGPARPVFHVCSLEASGLFYEHLGFALRKEDGECLYADRQGLSIRLLANAEHDPLRPHAEVYVETEAVDELHGEWRALDLIPVRTIVTPDIRAELRRRWATDDRVGLISDRVSEQPSGLREFSVTDIDSNEIRFGCSGPLPSETPYA